jgi:hypothetical protein
VTLDSGRRSRDDAVHEILHTTQAFAKVSDRQVEVTSQPCKGFGLEGRRVPRWWPAMRGARETLNRTYDN